MEVFTFAGSGGAGAGGGVDSPRRRRAVFSARRRFLRRAAAGAMVSIVSSESSSSMGVALRLRVLCGSGAGVREGSRFMLVSGSWDTKRPWDSGSITGAESTTIASGIEVMSTGGSSSSSNPLKTGALRLPRRGGSG